MFIHSLKITFLIFVFVSSLCVSLNAQIESEIFLKGAAVTDINLEEKELIDTIENGEWKSVLNTKLKKQYEEYAKNSLNKQKRINIRMTDRDLRHIQVRAIQEGIPYQSLISMLVHKFNQGKVSIKK